MVLVWVIVSTEIGPMDVTFTTPIGVLVKGDTWSCVEIPDSKTLFGTGKTVRVNATIDGRPLSAGAMPTGSGGHMLSISAKLRTALRKDLGDEVVVHLSERLS
jgi:hypothetical protein